MSNIQLAVVMSRNTTLADWDDQGVLNREMSLYRAILPYVGGVTFVSPDGDRDEELEERLCGIRVVGNKYHLSRRKFIAEFPRLAPWLQSGSTIFKSNQVLGGEMALALGRKVGAAVIARCGYLFSDFAIKDKARFSVRKWLKIRYARHLERKLFRGANLTVVTTPVMAKEIISSYGLSEKNVHVVPNYVDTDLFSPVPRVSSKNHIVFIGRLEAQKNLHALIEGCRGLDVTIDLVGEGSQKEDLRNFAESLGVKVNFLGRQPNSKLPEIITSGTLFVMPSYFEGHPKALLEAMACGVAVIGANSPGISECIRHGETGWLCGTQAADIRIALKKILNDPALDIKLGENARKEIVNTLSLPKIAERELGAYVSVLEK